MSVLPVFLPVFLPVGLSGWLARLACLALD